MSTIATVGYGDVHATGTSARAVVTAQIFFNLLFLGLVVRLVGPALSRRREARPAGRERSPRTGEAQPDEPA